MAQYVYRRPPYPYYDMEGIESWLEDLLRDGLWLDHDGYVFGMMQFRPGTPRKLKYRLEPIKKQSFLYLGQPKPPAPKALELYEEFGWEYLGTFYDFYVYRSMEENAVELNTDPSLQAQALATVCRRSLYMLLFISLISAVGLYLIFFRGFPMLRIINEGWRQILLTIAFLLIIPVLSAIPYLHLSVLKRSLAKGQPLKRNKNWRKGRFPREILMALPFLLYVAVMLSNARTTSMIYANEVNLETLTPPPPFVTMADVTDDRTVEYQESPLLSSWTTPFTPENYYWCESVWLHHQDQVKWSGDLEIYYHEAASEWVAKELYREYVRRQEQFLSINSPGAVFSAAEFDSSDYGFDELAVYDSFWGAYFVIRDGNRVIGATCALHEWGDSKHLYPLWLEKMAETLK